MTIQLIAQMDSNTNLFTVLKKLKECVGFFFFNNLIAINVLQISEGKDLETKNLT